VYVLVVLSGDVVSLTVGKTEQHRPADKENHCPPLISINSSEL